MITPMPKKPTQEMLIIYELICKELLQMKMDRNPISDLNLAGFMGNKRKYREKLEIIKEEIEIQEGITPA